MIECETEFRIRNKNQFGDRLYHTGLEMAVTEIDTMNAGRFRFQGNSPFE